MPATENLKVDFAPGGTLRVALNHGNRVLVGRDQEGRSVGVSVDLANDLAKDLDLSIEFIEFERAGDVSKAAPDNIWDLAFLAVDPARAEVMDFTAPYVRIEGSYLVAPGAVVEDPADILSSGLRVAAVEGSAYTLHLVRQPGAEALDIYPRIEDALLALDSGAADVIAGIRQAMDAESVRRPGSRVLDKPFMEIRQAMAMPAGRQRASEYLKVYLTAQIRSGAVGDILERYGVPRDCVIQP